MVVAEQPAKDVLSFGPFRLAVGERLLTKDGVAVELGGRALDILIALVSAPNEVVSKKDLLARVWPDVTVEESSLRFHMSGLRKALGDGQEGARYISTLAGRGYCFVAPVARVGGRTESAAAPAAGSLHGHLPNLLIRMVGRDVAVEELCADLRAKRFVSIVGPGGIGKTTVAIAVAHALSQELGEVCFADLGALSEPSLLVTTVAAALGCSAATPDPLTALASFLERKKVLLVLDSCEHLIEAAAVLAEHLSRTAPSVHILTTTREALRVEGENVYPLPPLEAPEDNASLTLAQIQDLAAVRLFIDRATAAGYRSELTEAEFRAVAAICSRLDGIALAIELAASRASVHGVRGVADLLDNRFKLLWPGRRLALPRHQTLQATLDWSYNLLSATEQRVLCRLSVFAGTFSLDAAQAVAADDDYDKLAVIDAIGRLVAKSLVQAQEFGGSARYRLLDTTRVYATTKLAETGSVNEFARRHAEYFLALIAPATPSDASPPSPTQHTRELDNVRAALDWAYAPHGEPKIGAALTVAYVPVWNYLGLMAECGQRVERALARIDPDAASEAPLRMRLHLALGASLFFTIGPDKRTRSVLAETLQLAERLDDTVAQMQTLWVITGLQLNAGESFAGQASAEQFVRVAERTGEPSTVIFAQRLLANALTFRGLHAQARTRLEAVLEAVAKGLTPPERLLRSMLMFRDVGLAGRLILARVLGLQGLVDTGARQAAACLAQAQAENNRLSICEVLRLATCPIALMSGDFDAAQQGVEMLIDVATRNNAPFWKDAGASLNARLLIAQGEFEEGVTQMRACLARSERTGWLVCVPEYLGALAEGLAGLGKNDEALETIDAALSRAETSGEAWYVPELHRIKGEILLEPGGDHAAAEICFARAADIAREQTAAFWELRATLSLARLRMSQSRNSDAAALLAPVYEAFTEGRDTADMRSARQLLDSLGARRPGA